MSKVIVKDEIMGFVKKNEDVFDDALARMAKDIKQIARMKVPLESGELMKTGMDKKIKKLKYRVSFETPYALYQEMGQRRDGSHIVRRYTTPGTGKQYLSSAGMQVAKNAIQYLKQSVIKIRP